MNTTEDHVLRLEDVSFTYSAGTPYQKVALDHVSVGIRRGSVTGLIGHTGSGKSTLVQLLNGLAKPDEGRVLLDGRDIWEKPKEIRSVRFRVGLVMQYPEYQLFEETIRADIAYGPRNMGLSDATIDQRVCEAADFVGLDRALLDRSPFDLSGGQKRRAAIAGVMAMHPDVLVLDEPAAGLDPQGRDAIFDGILAYRERSGSTVIVVSHSMEDMARICDELIVLSDGHLFLKGSPAEVFSRGRELSEIGLNVPEITEIMLQLADAGIPVNTGVYTVDDALKEILKLL